MTNSFDCTIIKNKIKYKYFVYDNYSWRNCNHIGILLDWNKMISIIKKYGKRNIMKVYNDNFINFDVIFENGFNNILNKYYNELIKNKENNWEQNKYHDLIIVDLDKNETIINGNIITFKQSKEILFNYLFNEY